MMPFFTEQVKPYESRIKKKREEVRTLDRIHIEFLYLQKENFLILTDIFTKLPKVI